MAALSKKEVKDSIQDFIVRERKKGLSFSQIKELLEDSVWPKTTIKRVLKEQQKEDQEYKIQALKDLQEKLLAKKRKRMHSRYARKYKHFYSNTLNHLKELEEKYEKQKIEHNKELLDDVSQKIQKKIETTKPHGPQPKVDSSAIEKAVNQEVSKELERMHAREEIKRELQQEMKVAPQAPVREIIREVQTQAPAPTVVAAPPAQGGKATKSQSRIQFDEGGATVSGPVQVNATEVTFKGPAPKSGISGEDLSTIENRLKKVVGSTAFDDAYRNPIVPDKVNLVQGPVGDRAQTGIQGLDPVIEGGLVRKTTSMVAGGPGTGKTTMGLQFIYKGAEQFQEAGVFISFEMTQGHIVDMGKMFNWDIQKHIDNNMIAVREFTPEQLDKMLKTGGGSLRDLVESMNATRIVIDSVTAFMLLYEGEIAQRRACLELFHNLGKWGCTTIVVAEEDHHAHNHEASVLEYETDAVVVLYNERRGDLRQRSLEIFKMRGTKHAGRVFPMRLTTDGLVVYPQQTF